ncbi:MAG TPA: LysE family translocator [Burkholderiaceae bacterium]
MTATPVPPQLLPMMLYCFAMSITPGPNNMLLTASGANFGYRLTLPQILGINAGGFVLATASCVGLGQLFVAWPALQAVLRIGGALYLLYLAAKLARARIGDATMLRPQSFVEGALFQVINPKSWLKAITLGSVFMPAGASPLPAALAIATVSALIGLPCVSLWALFGVAIRRFLQDARNQRLFNLAMAATLAVLALDFLR